MKILLLGMNHRTAPVEVRERLAVEEPAGPLRKLVAGDDVDEAVLFSTCNRVEVVALTRHPDAARHRLRSFLRRDLGGDDPALAGDRLDALLYEYTDAAAMRHVMRVASVGNSASTCVGKSAPSTSVYSSRDVMANTPPSSVSRVSRRGTQRGSAGSTRTISTMRRGWLAGPTESVAVCDCAS